MLIKVNLKVAPERPEVIELLNFKDQKAQQRFKENTSKTTEFSDCKKRKLTFNKKIDKWKHILEKHCTQAFPVIRIRHKNLKCSPVHKLIDKIYTLIKQHIVSVLGRDEGYTVKYNPLPEGVPEGEARGNS